MEKLLEIRLACVEDGLDNVGFRKISAYIKSIHSNTKVAYVRLQETYVALSKF